MPLNQHGTRGSIDIGHQCDVSWMASNKAVTKTMDFNINPDCCRVMEMNTALGSSSGLDVIMSPGGSSGHSDQHVPGSSMAFEPQNGHR